MRILDFPEILPGVTFEFVIDASGKLFMPRISEGIEDLIGCQVAECIANVEIIFQKVPPYALAALEVSICLSSKNLSPWKHEFPIHTTTGELKWLHGYASPQRKKDGAIHWNGLLLDTTEHKKTEENLQLIIDRLSLATQAGGVGIWDWDIVQDILIWDDSMFVLYGISRDRFSGAYAAWRSTLHPEDSQQADMAIQRALRGDKDLNTHFRVIRSDGAIRNIQALATIQRNAANVPVRMIGMNIDITEQKQTEFNLQQAWLKSEQLSNELTAYIDAVGELALVSITDLNGKITHANTKFCEVSGYSEEELIGQNHRIRNSGVHPKEFFTAMWKTVKWGDIWRQEVCDRCKDGQHYWVDSTIVPLKDQAGAITGYLSIRIDITERKKAERRVVKMATHDALTDLPNRYLLQDRIKQALAHDRRKHEQAAVLFIDLDNFKIINDSLGHDFGDLLLQEVATRLISVVREEDTVARQGGDEFIVLLPEVAGAYNAEHVAQIILNTLTQPYHINDKEIHIGGSIGIAIYPSDGKDVDTLLRNSDVAMYHAKNKGRNNYQFFNAEMNQLAVAKHALSVDLRYAIEHNGLLLHFQPVVELSSEKIVSMEVLLRWQHPQHGMISPAKFIPIAEETGLIIPIGEWVLRQACQQINAWKNQGYEVPILAINVSIRQFQKKTLVADFEAILQETGIDASHLILEITESLLAEDVDEASKLLHQLSALGFEISVDDFGTGYSSLSFLKRYPINTLKIDRSFVNDITTDPDDAVICAAIIALAHSLNMKVVAEGIETKPQLDFLTEQKCDRYQGFYFSRPLPAEDIEKMLKKA